MSDALENLRAAAAEYWQAKELADSWSYYQDETPPTRIPERAAYNRLADTKDREIRALERAKTALLEATLAWLKTI